MRVLSLTVAFASLFAAVSAAAAGPTCATEFECSLPTLREHESAVERRSSPAAPSPASLHSRMTNAERLAHGLPLKAPTRRRRGAAPPAASPVPGTTARGRIQVRSASGNVLGFVSRDPTYYLYQYTTDASKALELEVAYPAGATSVSQADLRIVDATSYPYLGLAQGRDSTSSDIGAGSFNYLYISATSQTGAGSTPQTVPNLASEVIGTARTSESAVWSIDFATGAIAPQWINTDGSAPATDLFLQSNGLYAGGDKAAFDARYPSGSSSISLVWVPL